MIENGLPEKHIVKKETRMERRRRRYAERIAWKNFLEKERSPNNKFKLIVIIALILLFTCIIAKINEQYQYYKYEKALEKMYQYEREYREPSKSPELPIIEVKKTLDGFKIKIDMIEV